MAVSHQIALRVQAQLTPQKFDSLYDRSYLLLIDRPPLVPSTLQEEMGSRLTMSNLPHIHHEQPRLVSLANPWYPLQATDPDILQQVVLHQATHRLTHQENRRLPQMSQRKRRIINEGEGGEDIEADKERGVSKGDTVKGVNKGEKDQEVEGAIMVTLAILVPRVLPGLRALQEGMDRTLIDPILRHR
ncbi:uncharacterized protein ARMOST_10212 [Armillaria ostoyae]|uniref:Uncharacterized protein n=1 Tax=Armillaria ostoyae TaxID=47428 RepID=A0A284RDN4_ARMOS|nr:uncharacterized protein ARMOST_10212 [Armillaria ostoyae]